MCADLSVNRRCRRELLQCTVLEENKKTEKDSSNIQLLHQPARRGGAVRIPFSCFRTVPFSPRLSSMATWVPQKNGRGTERERNQRYTVYRKKDHPEKKLLKGLPWPMSEGIAEKSSESLNPELITSYQLPTSNSEEGGNDQGEANNPQQQAGDTTSSAPPPSLAVVVAPPPLPRVGALLVETYGRVQPRKSPTTNAATVATTTNAHSNNNSPPPCAPSKVLFEYSRFLVSLKKMFI